MRPFVPPILVLSLLLAPTSSTAFAGEEDRPEPSGLRQGLPHSRPECPASANIDGFLAEGTEGSIDLSKADVRVWVTHKVDVDYYEDRCINEVLIESKVLNRGCEFRLLFRADPYSTELKLVDGVLSADSFCPGWPDYKEGVYRWEPGLHAPSLMLSKTMVPDRAADRSCVNISMEVSGTFEANPDRSRRPTVFTLDRMVVAGIFDSVGDVTGVCPRDPAELSLASKKPDTSLDAPSNGSFILEAHAASVIGDVSRSYDVRVAAVQDASDQVSQRETYQHESFHKGRGFMLGGYIGFSPTWWLEAGLLGGAMFGEKALSTGWELYKRNESGRLIPACNHPDSDCDATGGVDSEQSTYDPALTAMFLLEPRLRLFGKTSGKIRPYGLIATPLLVFDGYAVNDLRDITYPDRPAGAALGLSAGIGVTLSHKEGPRYFVDVPFTWYPSMSTGLSIPGLIRNAPPPPPTLGGMLMLRAGIGTEL